MRRVLRARLEQHLGGRIVSLQPLGGGCISNAYRLKLSQGQEGQNADNTKQQIVVKCSTGRFLLEARMLKDLRAARVPCPEVLYADDDMLALAWVAHAKGEITKQAAKHAARVLASLHRAPSQSSFGYAYDTPLGSLLQDNRASQSWIVFYRERRLLPLVRACLEAGQLEASLAEQICKLPLEQLLAHREGVRPALLHGDLWGGNMLFGEDSLQALIDPALYYGDPQVDCAMLKLFPAVPDDFFAVYRELMSSSADRLSREEERVCDDLYALYPLLVHCRLFGRRYNAPLARVLLKFQ